MSLKSFLNLGGKPQVILKHYGPGPHPGTGTEQSVHGRGGGGVASVLDTETVDRDTEAGSPPSEVARLIRLGEEARPSLDRIMQRVQDESKAIEAEIEETERLASLQSDKNSLSGLYRRKVSDKLLDAYAQHYPGASTADIQSAWLKADRVPAKFHELMRLGEVLPELHGKLPLTATAQRHMLEYWGEYGFTGSEEKGVTLEDGNFVIPNREAGEALLADLENREYSAYSGPERKMWSTLMSKLRKEGYRTRWDRRESQLFTPFEYQDPQVWLGETDNNTMLTGAALDESYWVIGDKEVSRWEDGASTQVVESGHFIYEVPRFNDAGQRLQDLHSDQPLIYGIFDHPPVSADRLAEYKKLFPNQTFREIAYSEYTSALEHEYGFWSQFEGDSSSYDGVRKLKNQISEKYTQGFGEWLGQYREVGGEVTVARKTKNVEKFLADVDKVYPTDWIEASNESGRLSFQRKKVRGHYTEPGYRGGQDLQPGEGRIISDGTTDTNLHEFGHRVEHIYPPLYEAERDFYSYRTADIQSVSLQRTYPGSGYKSNEMSRPDGFTDAYMGKRYSNGFELTSMAMPRITTGGVKINTEGKLSTKGDVAWSHPASPYRMDEEMLHWFLGVLIDV